MNTYLKTFLVLSICVAIVGVAIQEVLVRYESEIARIKKESPTLGIIWDKLHHLPAIPRFLVSLFSYFPSYSSLTSAKQASPQPQVIRTKGKDRLFTKDELRKLDGKDGSNGPYLAILGRVYNVRKGVKHYGPGGGYEFFSGRDASRAYVSGDFSEAGLVDDISGLSTSDYIGLDEWMKFYDKDYKYVGKLIGRYYDERGEPTEYYYDAQKWISESYAAKESDDLEKKMFPPCNSEWNPETGSRLWCTQKSGGIQREWVGVPRKLFTPGKGKSRCACVRNSGPPSHDPKRTKHQDRGDLDHPNIQEYPGCPQDQTECYVKLD